MHVKAKRRRIPAVILIIAFLFGFIFNEPFMQTSAQAAPSDHVVDPEIWSRIDAIASLYDNYMDQDNQAAYNLSFAKAAAWSPVEWQAVFDPLNTPQLLDKVSQDNIDLIKVVNALQELLTFDYRAPISVRDSNFEEYRLKYWDNFNKLFGEPLLINQVNFFVSDVQREWFNLIIAYTNTDQEAIVNKNNGAWVTRLSSYLLEAIDLTMLKPEHIDTVEAFNDLGWDNVTLHKFALTLLAALDPVPSSDQYYAGTQNAFGLALYRSKISLHGGDTVSWIAAPQPLVNFMSGEISVLASSNSLDIEPIVLNPYTNETIDLSSIQNLDRQNFVSWASSDPSVVDVRTDPNTNKQALYAIKSGVSYITVYRNSSGLNEGNANKTWLYKFRINVLDPISLTINKQMKSPYTKPFTGSVTTDGEVFGSESNWFQYHKFSATDLSSGAYCELISGRDETKVGYLHVIRDGNMVTVSYRLDNNLIAGEDAKLLITNVIPNKDSPGQQPYSITTVNGNSGSITLDLTSISLTKKGIPQNISSAQSLNVYLHTTASGTINDPHFYVKVTGPSYPNGAVFAFSVNYPVQLNNLLPGDYHIEEVEANGTALSANSKFKPLYIDGQDKTLVSGAYKMTIKNEARTK